MTYAYNTHGAPAVGGGLPGLPQRQSSGGITSGAIPVNAQFGYADEQPANAVEVGAIVERADYPALSEMIPHTFEQTVQLPMVAPSYSGASTPVVKFSEDASRLFVGSTSGNSYAKMFVRNGESFSEVAYNVTTGSNHTCFEFSKDLNYVYAGTSATGNNAIHHGKWNGAGYSFTNNIGGSSWPVKLLAISPDGTLLAAASSTTSSGVERVKLWRRSGDTFTAVTLPASGNVVVWSIDFSKDGKYLYYSQNSAPYLRVFDVSVSTPAEVTHWVSLSAPYIFKVLSDDRLIGFTTSSSAPATNKAVIIARRGDLFVPGVAPEVTNFPYISTTSILGSPIIEADDGARVAVFTATSRSGGSPIAYDFSRSSDGLYIENAQSSVSRADLTPVIFSASASADSKFLALGLNASPWLAVFGSESKMVARLNGRSPTGQKLYMKAG